MTLPTKKDWLVAETLADPSESFVLWAIQNRLCPKRDDFRKHFAQDFPANDLIDDLEERGLIEEIESALVLTDLGKLVTGSLSENNLTTEMAESSDATTEGSFETADGKEHRLTQRRWFPVAVVASVMMVAACALASPLAIRSFSQQLTLSNGNSVWMLLCTTFVLVMVLGSALLYGGMVRRKNLAGLMMCSVMVLATVSLQWLLFGYSLAFGDSQSGLIGWKLDHAGRAILSNDPFPGTHIPAFSHYMYQGLLAIFAAALISGALAERVRLGSYGVFVLLWVALIYEPVVHWVWAVDAHGNSTGWLAKIGVRDFAGGIIVHSVAGWGALAGVLFLGPRIGRFGPGGEVNAIPGHNLGISTTGCLLLWFGWWGLNLGNAVAGSDTMARIWVNTHSAAAGGALAALLTSWALFSKPDLSLTLNGCVAGLVSITAPCAFVTPALSILIALVAGGLVVLAVVMFDRLRIDDPVGVLSMYLINGIWGGLCVGLFGKANVLENGVEVPTGLANDGLLIAGDTSQLGLQVFGILAVASYAFLGSFAIWWLVRLLVGIRVSREQEELLDIYSSYSVEPRAAAVPPDGGRRFSVVVEGVESQDLLETWAALCRPGSSPPSAEFRAVYPHVTEVLGNHFRFRGGDPDQMRESLERLLKHHLKQSTCRTRVES